MEKVLKGISGNNSFAAKRARQLGLQEMMFHWHIPTLWGRETRIKLDEKEFANVFEALLGAVCRHCQNEHRDWKQGCYRVMQRFGLDIDGALRAAETQEHHVHNMTIEEVQTQVNAFRRELQDFENSESTRQKAWWKNC